MVTSLLYQKHKNLINYGVIGVSAALVDLLFFILFFNVFKISPLIATFMSVSVSTVYGFTINSVFNFKTLDLIKKRFLLYSSVSLFAILSSMAIIKVFVSFNIDPNIGKILSFPPIVTAQYLLNKKFAFKASAK